MNVRTFCFFAALAGTTIAACSSNTGTNDTGDGTADNASSDLVVVCGKGECGPELGMPTKICPDGSLGGNIGRCIKNLPASTAAGSKCHWEIRECPGPTPTPVPPKCDCGPKPMIMVACPDGSAESPICVDIDPSATGGTPSPDASGATPVKDKCEWRIPPCPKPPPTAVGKCDLPNACGPALGMPNYLCPDGKTVAGPGPCVERAGTCVWDIISCPVCDPAGPAPHPACSWDLKTCSWDCPVCDPVGTAPAPGCKWDTKACVWLCL